MDQSKPNRPASDNTAPAQAAIAQTGIDRFLATEEALIPSSGFIASVMERVHEEAIAPPPIPFPWRRAVPGMIMVIGVLGWGGFEFVHLAVPAVRELPFNAQLLSAALVRPLEQAGWIAVALTASLLSWLLSSRFAGRSNLL
jgi:hypothetical protein